MSVEVPKEILEPFRHKELMPDASTLTVEQVEALFSGDAIASSSQHESLKDGEAKEKSAEKDLTFVQKVPSSIALIRDFFNPFKFPNFPQHPLPA
jgi:hypothetical protein